MKVVFILFLSCSSSPEAIRVEGVEVGDCTDRADNDADGAFDCDDPGCAGSPDCVDPVQEPSEPSQPNEPASTLPEAEPIRQEVCTDGVDNDYDALTDCNDPNCFDHEACSETPVEKEYFCADDSDNDGDGYIDCEDTDCDDDYYCH